MRRAPKAHARALLGCLLACGACARAGGCGEEPLAELIEVHGRGVERDFAGRVERWQDAQVGARFGLGDGVRASAAAHAIVELRDGSLVRLKPGTLLRFMAATEGTAEQALDVQTGEAEITVGAVDMPLRTELGVAVIERGSRISLLRKGPARLQYRIELGSAKLQRARGGHELVHAGELVEVGIGMAVLDRRRVPAASPAPQPAPATGAAPAADAAPGDAQTALPPQPPITPATPASDSSVLGPGPDRISLGAAAGESFTVHAARLPVAVAFDVAGRCEGDAALLVDGQPRARGREHVGAAIGAGRHGYDLRCVQPDGSLAERGVAGGHVTVLRDGGSTPLPRRAPTSFVDADGKRYTVLFQNLLPRIELRWPRAPESAAYSVHVQSEGRPPSERPTRKPELTFAAGELREGTHLLHFRTQEGARSKVTTLEIRFDNAAPRASVMRPRDGSFAPGAMVEVAGVALPGYRVSLQNGAIELDRQYRFSGKVVTTPARPDIALRIESPRGGVHYYVRRAASAP